MTRDEMGAKRGKHSADLRRERLAAELRANLGKRKAQARARGAHKPPTGDREPAEDKRWRG